MATHSVLLRVAIFYYSHIFGFYFWIILFWEISQQGALNKPRIVQAYFLGCFLSALELTVVFRQVKTNTNQGKF